MPTTTLVEAANSSSGSCFAETTLAEVETASAETAYVEAATAPAHSVVAPAMVLEIEGSHKDYLTIFSQIMNLMPSFVLQAKDVINQL